MEIEKSIYKNLLSFRTLITNYQRNKIISLTIALKKNKILQINLAKEIKDLYTGNCETSLREAKGLEKWRDPPRPWDGGLSIAKTQFFQCTLLVQIVNAIPVKILSGFFLVEINRF